jgi:hypothetical protein
MDFSGFTMTREQEDAMIRVLMQELMSEIALFLGNY